KRGLSKGLFEWLAKAPWGNPGFAALVLSLTLFGFMGGITGVTFGAEQVNIISHNTLRIPGHFHATVVAGTTLAFMGLTYYVVPLIFRRRHDHRGVVRDSPAPLGRPVRRRGLQAAHRADRVRLPRDHGRGRAPGRARRRPLRRADGRFGLLRPARPRHRRGRGAGPARSPDREAHPDFGAVGPGLHLPGGVRHLLLPQLEVARRHLAGAVMLRTRPQFVAVRTVAIVPVGTRRLLIGWLALAVGSLVVAGI